MDTWAYPYRMPIFRELARQVRLDLFFTRPRPLDHLDEISSFGGNMPFRSGHLLFAYVPMHLLWEKHDVYFIGQIGVQSVLGAFLTMLVAQIRNKPLVLWTDYIETDFYKKTKPAKRFFGGFVRRAVVRRCAAAMAFGRYTADYLKSIRSDLKLFEVKQVVPETCNPDPDLPVREAKYRDKVIVLSMGYLRKGKGLDFLIREFAEIADENSVLVICGSGKEEGNLKRLAAAYPDAQIEFPGHVEAAEKAKWFLMADVFVFSSEHDTWGLVVNEAMYYGLPVIVTDASGSHELVQDNGIIIPSRDGKALKSALNKLMSDAQIRAEMGKKSKQIISKYGTGYGVNAFMEVIRYASAARP